jgi:hypothetical protein
MGAGQTLHQATQQARSVHRLPAEPSQRTVHARRPHLLRRRLHVSDPGPLAAQDNVAIPLKVQSAASIRRVYAYLQQGASDGQSAYVVKYSADGGATWSVLEKMSIAQNIGTPFKNTWDFLVAQGYSKPETRRLPYNDYGLITIAPITGSGVAQAVATASYDASTSGLVAGDFVFLEFGLANEEQLA